MSTFLNRLASPVPYQWQAYDRPSDHFPFTMRTVQQKELRALATMLVRCFYPEDGFLAWLNPLLQLSVYEDLKSRFQSGDPNYTCLVAVASPQKVGSTQTRSQTTANCVAGTVELSRRPLSFWQFTDRYLYISNLAVDPAYRRQGVARELLRSCEQVAREWGYEDLYLHVVKDNRPAQQLYESMGYQLKRVEFKPMSVLFGRSSQLFLHKSLKP